MSKLPKPRKRGDAYYIEIMINGERDYATFDTERECQQWAATQKLKARAGQKLKQHKKTSITLHELMQLHMQTREGKKGADYDREMLNALPRDYPWLTDKMVVDITAADLTRYRNMRFQQVKSSTVRRNFSYLSAVFTHAVRDLFIIDKNPCNDVNKPSDGKSRYRRISDDETTVIVALCGYELGQQPVTARHYVGWAFLWALESAMRRNEILGMDWSDVHKNHVHLPTSKTDDSRDVPLSPVMRELLECLPHDKGAVIPVKEETFATNWRRVKAKFEQFVPDVQFRDTRHEAISRMVKSKRLPVEQLAKITGHKKIETLVNVYYNPTADELYDALYGD